MSSPVRFAEQSLFRHAQSGIAFRRRPSVCTAAAAVASRAVGRAPCWTVFGRQRATPASHARVDGWGHAL